ncbi:dynamin family protein [Lentibacillus sp.]|uniref:dynamin family protein n=1 Tax=Lentibacillus sp. TaxID=1925746 RepID=UPI002B4B790D|nr:dynamin family protein [Lentibacillus sp.]HLS09314.1 dynamin family protein [Lentibacillus sp.]
MITEAKQSRITRQHLASLYQLMLENGDTKSAEKLLQISEKWLKGEFMISFTGHFSAGKSSMINHLLEKSILPKSPIPTSANVVKIKSGKGIARVLTDEGTIFEYEEPYDIDVIKEYAKSKVSIKEIEINTKEPILPAESVMIDTPGIDAADDADRLITESSLHLVDVLFYVMDYNHVQSEVNLHFLKKVQDHAIPVYIIINQIDKHDEQELTFDDFSGKIKQTFDQWDIFPEIIYYSSLIDRYTPHNQIDDVKKKLFSLLNTEREALLNIDRSIDQVVSEHKDYLLQVYENESADLKAHGAEHPTDTAARLDELNAEIACIKNIPDKMEDDFRKEVNTTLKNAYLMPAKLRDLAYSYLESQQRDFRVGLFASKKKTEDERQKRETDFLNSLQQTIETSIQWRLRDKLLNLLQAYELYNQDLSQQIQNISIAYDADSLQALINPGATVNGDYVLHYTDDVSHDVKRKYKQEVLKLWDSIHDEISGKIADELSQYESERDELSHIYEQYEMNERLKNDLEEKKRKVDDALTDPKAEPEDWRLIEETLASNDALVKHLESLPVQQPNESVTDDQDNQTATKPAYPVHHILKDLEKTIETISDFTGFQSIIGDLKRKYDRLSNRTYTIALFGAFSAGKSSLANALIGEHVLPSAPNPTTAVINRIHPVTEEKGHGTVIIKMKDEATLVNDLRALVHQFTPEANSFAELLNWISKHNIHQSGWLPKTHQAYLTAILDGYHYSKKNIGREMTVGLNEFAAFVTEETVACYLESVDLYYDCSLTREGITLVDTPGADSINARHTNVAFDYIKHADAILYVTYYNHAFSRADKDFLMQLGRVKDSFQLDKMFFIMNASDLAENEAEVQMVQQYIQEQLTSLGIRFPRLFPISSKQSLEEKQRNKKLNEQMKAFEDAFDYFIHQELASITIRSAVRDIQRARQAMRHYLDSIKMNAAEKEHARTELIEKQTSLKKLAEKIDTDLYEQKISQKLEKQLYYVLERLSIRFHDLFKETFNPATITGSGKKAQQQLKNSFENLLDYAGYELLQELRAVSLRIESFIYDLKQEVYFEYTNKSSQIDTTFLLPDFEESELTTPEYEQAFSNLNAQTFDKELKQFNGTKAFFAKNQKESMKENLFERLYPFADQYITENGKTMHTHYTRQWHDMMDAMKQFIVQHAENYIDHQLRMISDQSIDLGTLSQKHDTLTQILTNYEELNRS